MGADEKKALRTWAKVLRDKLDATYRTTADAAIAEHVLASNAFAGASTVFAYRSVGSEVDTERIIEAALRGGKVVALPRCRARRCAMTWHRIGGLDELAPGTFGIPEPPDDPATLIDPACAADEGTALALVPGLLFDRAGYRLGYGGGFYDTFLADFPGVSVGLIRERQLVESLADRKALEPFDLPADLLVTEAGIPPA